MIPAILIQVRMNGSTLFQPRYLVVNLKTGQYGPFELPARSAKAHQSLPWSGILSSVL